MRILIFGGNGFVGRNLLKKLKDLHEIFITSRKVEKPFANQNTKYVKFDIERNISEIKPDIVINLIGTLKETKNITYEEIHIKIIEKILHSMQKNKIKKIIHISALGVNKGCNSRYFKTKEIAEEKIIKANLDYLIIRPPVMIGEGQKLNEELKNLSKITPIIIAPKSIIRVSPVDYTLKEILYGLEGKNGIVEITGKKISYKELFKEILKNIGIKRIVVEVPTWFLIPAVIFSSFLKDPPITFETYKMILCSQKIYK